MAARALLQVAQGSLRCTICCDFLDRPVSLPCGHVYCCECATRCIDSRPLCPLCNKAIHNIRNAVPLPNLASLMDVIRVVADIHCTDPILQDQSVAAADNDVTSAPVIAPPESNGSALTVPLSLPDGEGAEPLHATQSVPLTSKDAAVPPVSTTPVIPATENEQNGFGSDEETPPMPSTQAEGPAQPPSTFQPLLEQESMQHQEAMLPTQSQTHYIRVRRHQSTGDVSNEGQYLYGGTCVMCGTDIKNRSQISRLLNRVISRDPSCDKVMLRSMSERRLSEKIGLLWELWCPTLTPSDVGHAASSANDSGGSGVKEAHQLPDTSLAASDRGREEPLTSVPLKMLAHKSCLEWCVLQSWVRDQVYELTLSLSTSALRDLSCGSTKPLCSFCCENVGTHLIPCCRCGNRFYHYPCALLTGSGVCHMTDSPGILYCSSCWKREHPSPEGARTTT